MPRRVAVLPLPRARRALDRVWVALCAAAPLLAFTAPLLAFTAPLLAFTAPLPALAAELPVVGSLRTAAGGPVTDGTYAMQVVLYDAAQPPQPMHTETFIAVDVQAGVFSVVLGQAGSPPLDGPAIAANAASVGVTVGAEPELPLVPLRPVLRAWHAAFADKAQDASHAALADDALQAQTAINAISADTAKQADSATAAEEAAVANKALSLQCTGCVTAEMLAPGTLDAAVLLAADNTLTGDNALTGTTTFDGAATFKDAATFKNAVLLDGSVKASQPVSGQDFQLQLFQLQNAAAPPAPCDASTAGMLYFDTNDKSFLGCDGDGWKPLYQQPPLGADASNPAGSCLAIKTATPGAVSGLYWLQTAAEPFEAWCDMETDGGGWTMCVTDNQTWRMSTEVSAGGKAFGQDGYRSDCRDVPFSEVLYVNHSSNDAKAWFARSGGQKLKASAVGYNTKGNDLGAWQAAGGAASGSWTYQLLVCDQPMYTGLFMSGVTGGCYKSCGSWCGDQSSHYYRFDGSDSSNYNGVSFAENGHKNVSGKLMSVGIR